MAHAETEAAANLALRSDDPADLTKFLEVTHNTAYAIDVRAQVTAIAGDDQYGTEVRNGARVALAGSTAMQAEFLEVDRHRAAERDHATATHNYIATSLMIETSQIAQQAVEFARTAQAAAAEARGAAEAAVGYANDSRQGGRPGTDVRHPGRRPRPRRRRVRGEGRAGGPHRRRGGQAGAAVGQGGVSLGTLGPRLGRRGGQGREQRLRRLRRRVRLGAAGEQERGGSGPDRRRGVRALPR